MQQHSKIRSFTDLDAWQQGHRLVLITYKATKTFPHHEQFGLTNQIQRAVVSVTSNIAEGFSRNSSKEKINFYYMALGSLTEVQNQLVIARDLGYLEGDSFKKIAEQTIRVNKLINGLIKRLKQRTD